MSICHTALRLGLLQPGRDPLRHHCVGSRHHAVVEGLRFLGVEGLQHIGGDLGWAGWPPDACEMRPHMGSWCLQTHPQAWKCVGLDVLDD